MLKQVQHDEMSLQERDKEHIWHPLTQHQTSAPPIGVIKAKGAVLIDEDGNEYIDGIASWYTAIFGHCNEYIIEAVSQQMKQLDQIVFTGFTHEPAVRLSEKLIDILPDNQKKIFFNDNGSTAVEAAIKMAIQYYHNKGEKRNTLIAFENGFHGDTFGAMSVSGLSVYNGPFEEFFLNVIRIPIPTNENIQDTFKRLDALLQENNVAAFIYEPLVQGAAGMKMYDAALLDKLLVTFQKHGVLTIADEVMTGFGKTGRHFASQYLHTQPDIICLSKALTAGMVPMGITSCTQQVFDAFLDNEIGKGFFHAHTYSANPLACASAIAGIELLTSEEMQSNIQRISDSNLAFAEKIKEHKGVMNVRNLGVILAMELTITMDRYGDLRNQLYRFFMNEGVCLRPLGNTIYILPPYVITEEQLNQIYSTIERYLDSIKSSIGEL